MLQKNPESPVAGFPDQLIFLGGRGFVFRPSGI